MHVIFSRPFANQWQQYLDEQQLHGLLRLFSVNPEYGMPMPKGHGLRRARWEFNLQDDSTGVKVIYYWHARTSGLYLLSIFPKETQDNFSQCQVSAIKQEVASVFNRG